MSDLAPKSGLFSTVVAVLGAFLIFALILFIAYMPHTPQPLSQGTKTPEERAVILGELRAREASLSGSYGWVDQSKGIVRVPISRAMQLTIDDINRQK